MQRVRGQRRKSNEVWEQRRKETGRVEAESDSAFCSMALVSLSRTVVGVCYESITSACGGGDLWRVARSHPWATPGACLSSPARDLRTLTLCPSRPRWRPQRPNCRWCEHLWHLYWPWCRHRPGWCHRLSGWGRSRRPSAGTHSGEDICQIVNFTKL